MSAKRELHGVWKTLAIQHQQIAVLLERTKQAGKERAACWLTARTALVSHERGEVREVYPVLRQYQELREIADAHDRDATALERLVLALDDTPIDSDEWTASFAVLADSVIGHAAEEEREFFLKAQATIGNAVSNRLDGTFSRASQQLAAQV